MDNVSLVKTRLRASRRGEVPSPVGFRQPNPYENVRIFLECAIYQTHVVDRFREWSYNSLQITLQSFIIKACGTRLSVAHY